MNFSWFVASIAVPPICFSKKHHCTNGLYYFSLTESFYSPKNRFIKCTWFRVFCACFLSERSGESPSLSVRRLCKTCRLNKSFCKERGGLESLKNSSWKLLAKYIFLFSGIANIVFQLDAVKFAIELILRIQNNDQSFVCTCSLWVSRLKKQAIGCIAFA